MGLVFQKSALPTILHFARVTAAPLPHVCTYLWSIWTFVNVRVSISLSALRATPKFATFAKQCLLSHFWIRIFSGLISRWTILYECKYFNALARCEIYLQTSYSGLLSFYKKVNIFNITFRYSLKLWEHGIYVSAITGKLYWANLA